MKKGILWLTLLMLLCSSAFAQESGEQDPTGNTILIAYFTWADNTVVKDAQASIASALDHYQNMGDAGSGVDATSSASLLQPGNTAIMAGHIHDLVGGDLFSIQVSEPYPDNYDECLERASDELDTDARPALKTHVENFAQYDTIFLGMPNWWYSCPRAILTFIEEYDFSGKAVIPFVAHGTGGISGSVRDMSEALPDSSNLLEPIGVYRPDIATCQPVIASWLQTLGVKADDRLGASALVLTLTNASGAALTAQLEDNPASRALLGSLPMTVTFEDYNATEKIAYLAAPLDTTGAPDSCDPTVGTLAYYAPWGNLSIFYQDFRFSQGLVPLGYIDADPDSLSAMMGEWILSAGQANP